MSLRVLALRLDLVEGVTTADTFGDLNERGKQGRSLWKDTTCRPFVEGAATRCTTWMRAWAGMRVL
jgi:hypothetical protein